MSEKNTTSQPGTIDELKPDNKNFNKHTEYGMALLEKSLRQNGAGRSILVDKDDNIIAGNGIVEAAQNAGITKTRVVEVTGDELVVVKRTDLALDSKAGREMALADNATAAVDLEWDNEVIAEVAADFDIDVSGWGVELDDAPRKGWGDGAKGEKCCNLILTHAFHERKWGGFVSSYTSGEEGVPLSLVKTKDYVELFADNAIIYLDKLLGLVSTGDYCLVSTPRRRHKEWNFANEVCKVIAQKKGIHFVEDFCEAQDKTRVGGKPFIANKDIDKKNVIIYDDIVTTGETLRKTKELLKGKNVVIIVGINNN